MSAVTSTPGGPGVPHQGQADPGLQPGWGVSPERQQAIAEVLGGLAPPAGRLAPVQLRAVTAGLAARRGLWADLVVRDPDVRWYLPLHRSNSSTLAAATLRRIGLREATDLEGGFQAWKAAGLPTRPAQPPG